MRVVTVMLALAGLAACHEPDPDLRALDDSATASDTADDDTQVADVADTAVEAESGDSADDGATQVVEPDADATLDDADSAPEVADDALVETEPDTAAPPDDTSVDASDDTAPEVVEEVVEDVVPDEPEVVVEPVWTVVVNEVDCRGLPSDWVELVNTGDTDIPLDLVFATDDPASAAHRQPLGTGTLAPGGRLVVDLTAFGVSCGSEGVAVVKASGVVLDAAPAGNDPDGYTYGRLPDISGAFTVTKPTRGAPNQAPDLDPFDPIGTLYDPLRPVANIALTLDATAYASLKAEPQTWVTGTFRLTDEFGTVEQPVGVRLKGRIGSFRTIDQKAGFKLDFNRWWPGGNMRGALAMTLNNMVQDGAKVHEMVAYALFRAMGVPAPRVGYVWVKVNGSDYGLYADIEAYAEPWYSNHFASTKAAFEGQYGDDFVQAQAYQLDLDEGSEAGRVDLATLIDAVQYTPRGLGFMVATAAFVDWNEVLAMMATEIFIGHWDGYAPTRNNFIVHFDDDGLASLMPWGTDQTFASSLGWYDGQGLLLQGCMSDKACKIAFEAKLLDLAAIVDAGQVVDALAGVPDIIQPYIDVEPREGKGADASGGFDGAVSFLDARSADIRGRIGCRRDPAQDADHDGASCDLDCADSDASRHWGAVDACGDGVDQDCDGKTDNGSTCEDCTPHATNGRNYLFCARPRARAAAAANCSAHGMTLVAIGAGTENSWLASEAKNAGMGSFWIGANDLGQEGVYTWVDGSPLAGNYRNYASNQPDDFAAAEDCTLLNPTAGNGTWNDVDCKLWLAAVCEQP